MVMSADGELEEDVGEAAISDEVDRTYRKFEARESKTKISNDERRMSLKTFNNFHYLFYRV